jgi:2,5-dihydroxypyridine 5,6-dioxygenase
MSEYTEGMKSMLVVWTEIRPGEHWLVIADNEGRSMWLGQIAMEIMTSMGVVAILSVINPPELEISEEPPKALAAAMKNVDDIISIAEKNPHVHTNARKEATAAEARYYVMKGLSLDDLRQSVSVPDVRRIKERTENLASRLAQSKIARVTSSAGTDIQIKLTGRTGLALNPMSHLVSTLPDYAEAAIAPVEGFAEGIIIADLAIIQWEYLFQTPLRLVVKAGKVVDVSGGAQDVERLRKTLATDTNAANIAELGIGTSHILPRVIRGTRRDCARIGTVHIGLGKNDDIGGKNVSSVHLDCLMSNAVVELDGQSVLKDGNLVL